MDMIVLKAHLGDDGKVKVGDRLIGVSDHRARHLIKKGLAEPIEKKARPTSAPAGFRTGRGKSPSSSAPARQPKTSTSKNSEEK